MLQKPVALITGASRGLGRAMARAFAKNGYAIGINYATGEDQAKDTSKDVEAFGAPFKLLKADMRSSKEVEAMVRMLTVDWGRIDVLINNAGIARDQHLMKMSDEEWQDVLDVNLNGSFYCIRSVLPLMQVAKEGVIINITSYLASRPTVGAANYAVAKAGIIALTKSAALEMGRHNIRVNAVMPGFHVTDMNSKIWKKFEPIIRKQHILPDLPDRDDLADFVYQVAHLKSVSGQVYPFESRLL